MRHEHFLGRRTGICYKSLVQSHVSTLPPLFTSCSSLRSYGFLRFARCPPSCRYVAPPCGVCRRRQQQRAARRRHRRAAATTTAAAFALARTLNVVVELGRLVHVCTSERRAAAARVRGCAGCAVEARIRRAMCAQVAERALLRISSQTCRRTGQCHAALASQPRRERACWTLTTTLTMSRSLLRPGAP